MRIIHIVGARPQFVKMAVVSRAITVHNNRAAKGDRIEELIIHTGQHYDENMSAVFFEELEPPKPDYNLGIGSASQGAQTGRMLEAIETMLIDEQPDWVLLYGDTNSTLAGALAAAKLHIPAAHVEAGLRSFNRKMPEEINRVLTDHVSAILFCPTETAVENLEREGFTSIANEGRLIECTDSRLLDSALPTLDSPVVVNVGDVMFDSVLYNLKLTEAESSILKDLELKEEEYYLTTIHRAENTDDPKRLKEIFSAFQAIAAQGIKLVCPLHPRTRKAISKLGIEKQHTNFSLIEPVSYRNMLLLEKNARLILTDSGGVQKEAFILKKPCITLREETEWTETVETGWNVLVGADKGGILKAMEHFKSWKPPSPGVDPYGDGQAGARIVEVISCCL